MPTNPTHVGGKGAAGTLVIYPPDASGGDVQITSSNNTGGATVSVVFDAFSAARTIHVSDPGATAYLAMSTAALTQAELDVLDGVTAGTVTASKAVVVSADKDIGDFRNLDAVNIDAGASGTAGTVDIFPSTASKGKLTWQATDNTNNDATTFTNAAQAQASTITFPDLGATWSVVGTEGAQTVNGVKTFGSPIVYKAATGITAFASGGQASATALTAEFNNVTTCATAADSVKLPAAVLGQTITVQNNGAAALAVFPASGDAINSLSANASVSIPVGGQATFRAIDGTTWYSGAVVPLRGVPAAGAFSVTPRCIHTGAQSVTQSTDGTEVTITNTVLYVAELFVPCNMTITGAAVFWGATTDGNAKVCLFDSAGTRVAISASTDISGYTGDSFGSRIAFTSAYSALGPATYYLGVICDTNTNTINTHILGNFGAGEVTSLVYGTEAGYATITPPTTFTTAKGPIATLY